MNFEHHQKVDFEVSNAEGISPTKANVLLELFKKKLKELKYQDFYSDGIVGRIIDVNDFSWNQPMPHLLNCRYSIVKWNIIDNTPQAISNFNNVTRQKMAKMVSDIRMEIGGTHLQVNKISQF